MKMADYVKRKTLRLRHAIVKRLVPRLYEDWLMYGGQVADGIPRPMIQTALLHFGNSSHLVGVEIGVFEGVNAVSILQKLPIRVLYLIDPYIDTSDCMFIMKERLSRFPEAVLIREKSQDAINRIREKVDFVYIDGDHAYETVRNDISLYFGITKDGGLVGGHDYNTYAGVKKAVDEFTVERHLHLNLKESDWWVVKE